MGTLVPIDEGSNICAVRHLMHEICDNFHPFWAYRMQPKSRRRHEEEHV